MIALESDLKELFKIQRKLDERIVKEKELNEFRLFRPKALAAVVELGELCNELPEYTKHWSRKPNKMDKALEEYVDLFHFILSLGLEINYKVRRDITPRREDNFIEQSLALCSALMVTANYKTDYELIIKLLLGMGDMLEFEWTDVVFSYRKKNRENHKRQDDKY